MRRHVVDLRRERRVGPATPAVRDVTVVRRLLLDAPRNLAPHELGLDPVHTRHSTVSPIVGRQLPESPFAVRTRPAVRRRLLLIASRRVSVRSWRSRQLVVVDLGGVPALQSILAGQRRIAWQRQSLGVEIVVDFAVAGRVPAPVVPDACGLLAPLVVAQQMAHLVDEQARVLLDGVRRNPGIVVVQPPVRIHGHAADQIGLDRHEAEERRREIAALIRRPHARRLQRARIPVRLPLGAANQIEEPDSHVTLSEPASPSASARRTDGTPRAASIRPSGRFLLSQSVRAAAVGMSAFFLHATPRAIIAASHRSGVLLLMTAPASE